MPIEDYYEKAVELSTFKSLRIAGEEFPYFYIRWCNNEEELYNTVVSQRQRCQDPWSQLDIDFPDSDRESSAEPAIDTLQRALEPGYDKYFNSLPKVHFGECLKLQMIENESRFTPLVRRMALGLSCGNGWTTSILTTRISKQRFPVMRGLLGLKNNDTALLNK